MEPPLLEHLDGQAALVTGANRGMGRKIAEELSGLGAQVYAGIRDPEVKDSPAGCSIVEFDVTDDASIEGAVKRIEQEAGRLDLLVNNAGVISRYSHTLMDEPIESIDRVLATNLRGPMVLTKFALPLLLKNRGSRVVNISSGMGNLTGMNGGAPAYRISKVGLNGLTTYLHGEFHERYGLIANVVCPGWVRTEMGGEQAERPVEKGIETPLWLSRFAPGAPSGLWWRDKQVIDW